MILLSAETAHEAHIYREILHALDEGIVMLLREYGGRREKRDLLAVLHCLEGGADSYLGLAVSDVSADKAVHDPAAFHIRFGSFYGG